MYVCMYVCMYISMNVRIYFCCSKILFIHFCHFLFFLKLIYTCIHIHIYIRTYIYMYTYIHKHIFILLNTLHTYMCTRILVGWFWERRHLSISTWMNVRRESNRCWEWRRSSYSSYETPFIEPTQVAVCTVCMHVCMYTCVCMYLCMYVNICIFNSMYLCMYCMYDYNCIYVYVCMHVCMNVCIYVSKVGTWMWRRIERWNRSKIVLNEISAT